MKTLFKNLFFVTLLQIAAVSLCVSGETVLLNGSWTDYGNYRENSVQVGRFTLLKYSTDGKYIYTYGTDSLIRKWDNITGEILSEIKFDYFEHKPDGIEKFGLVDISPDGKYILIWHWEQNNYDIIAEVIMYDLSTKEVKFIVNPPFRTAMTSYGGPPVYVFGASVVAMFSFDGSLFVTNVNLSLEYSIYTANGVHSLWKSSDGSKLGKNYGGISRLQSISKDSKNFAYTYWISYDMNLKLPDVYGMRLNDTALYMNNSPSNIAFTNDSRNLAWIANENGKRTLFQWDISRIELLKQSIFEKNDENLDNMMFTNDDKFFVCEMDSILAFYQYPTAIKVFEMDFDFLKNYSEIKMNPVQNEIAVAGKDGILRIIKLEKVEKELISVFRADTTVVQKGTPLGFKDFSYGEPNSWRWDFGDGAYSSEQNPEHIYSQVGTYDVSLIASNTTYADTSKKVNYITVIEPNDVNEYTNDNRYSFTISPNPATDYIEFPSDFLINNEIIIYSVIGKIFFKGNAEKKINISNLTPGIYFIKVKDKVYKFVKM